MRATSVLGLFLFVILSTGFARAEESIEPGRYGAEWAVTEDTVFLGPTYKGDKLDAAFFFSGHKYRDEVPAESWVVNARLGARYNLGSYNYLAYGLLANYVVIGKDYGSGTGSSFNNTLAYNGTDPVNTAGSGRVGPYLAIQRHFPHSGVFVELAVMLYAYQTNIMNDGKGGKVVTHDDRYLESGYVGLGWLFGQSGDDIKN